MHSFLFSVLWFVINNLEKRERFWVHKHRVRKQLANLGYKLILEQFTSDLCWLKQHTNQQTIWSITDMFRLGTSWWALFLTAVADINSLHVVYIQCECNYCAPFSPPTCCLSYLLPYRDHQCYPPAGKGFLFRQRTRTYSKLKHYKQWFMCITPTASSCWL